jgi:hypothetical protein
MKIIITNVVLDVSFCRIYYDYCFCLSTRSFSLFVFIYLFVCAYIALPILCQKNNRNTNRNRNWTRQRKLLVNVSAFYSSCSSSDASSHHADLPSSSADDPQRPFSMTLTQWDVLILVVVALRRLGNGPIVNLVLLPILLHGIASAAML